MSVKVSDLIEKLNIELAMISSVLSKYEHNRTGKRAVIISIQYKIKRMFERLESLEKLLKL